MYCMQIVALKHFIFLSWFFMYFHKNLNQWDINNTFLPPFQALRALPFLANHTAVSMNSIVNKPLSEWHERKGLCMADRSELGIPWPVLSVSSASRLMSTLTVALHFRTEGRRFARKKGFFRIPRNVVLNLMSCNKNW